MKNLHDLMLFGVHVGKTGFTNLARLKSLQALYVKTTSDLPLSSLNALNGLSRLSNLTVNSLIADSTTLDISGLENLERISLGWKKKGGLQDRDLACLTKLKTLKWIQAGLDLPITDAGIAHLTGLSAMDRLSLGGPALTDRSLACFARMPRLNWLETRGNFTDAGVRRLEGMKNLGYVGVYSSQDFAEDAEQRLRKRLPENYKIVLTSDKALVRDSGSSTHPKPGTAAPDFSVTTLDGSKFTLSEKRGKVVLLHFWGTWCAPCVKNLPALRTFHDRISSRYGDRVVCLDLVMEDNDLKLRSLIKAHNITWPQALTGQHSKIVASYGVTSAPDDFMIGRDGRILLNRESSEGPSDTERVIDKALGISAPRTVQRSSAPILIRR